MAFDIGKIYRAVVEDARSPKKDGRVRVRIVGLHTDDKTLVKTSDLPWAETMESIHFGYGSGIGITSIPRTGTWVWVFLENGNPNKPIIMGAVPGMSTQTSDFDLPKADRLNHYDVNTLADTHYADKHVIETWCGHTIEIDDFGGSEMIKITHSPSGTYIHMHPNGDITIDVKGKTLINTVGDTDIKTGGKTKIDTAGATDIISGGACTVKAPTIQLNP